jgi:hypothetical protein
MVCQVEVETLVFRKFWWHDQKPLEEFVTDEWEKYSK